jgi:hypothetical protein
MLSYNYAIIKENHPELERESVLDPNKNSNKYSPKKKYAMIVKGVHKDGSESIYFIKYSNDIVELQQMVSQYPSWYNYPIGISKNIQGYLTNLN